MKTYQYTSPENTVVAVIDEDGISRMSMLASALPEGVDVLPFPFDAAARAAKNEQINTWRLQANRGTFTHGGKLFACDELSRGDIDGITSFVTLAGGLPPGWPGAWKAVDNSFFPIATVAEWAAFVASMVAAGNANFAKSQALKAALASATTQAEIDAIVW